MQSWINARDRGLAILIWLALTFVVFWLFSHIVNTLLLISLAAVLAYALTPAVKLLDRWIPRSLAVILVYILALSALAGLAYFVFSTAVNQFSAFAQQLPGLVKASTPQNPSGIEQLLRPLGVTDDDFNQARQQVINWATSNAGQIATQAVPILTGVAGAVVDLILVIVLSIYLVIDGPRAIRWLRRAAPIRQRSRTLFFLDTLGHTVGGYIRGELFMAALLGVLVGAGMAVFGLPYALLLGVLAAIFEFVPILGTLVSGATCVLIALPTRGWFIAVVVLVYFIFVHILEGDIIGPRIIGRALGIHPVVAIGALLAGTEIFGLWGAIFAAPLAGLIQAVLVALWTQWHKAHPEEFLPPTDDEVVTIAKTVDETVG
ncbi:MAG TPA: AI-2E family transporter [Ktedonobacterales bacterium]|nr:AI-2E family transporter [Ktedonobacterales bacterium]